VVVFFRASLHRVSRLSGSVIPISINGEIRRVIAFNRFQGPHRTLVMWRPVAVAAEEATEPTAGSCAYRRTVLRVDGRTN